MPGITRQSESFHFVDTSVASRGQEIDDAREAAEDFSDLIRTVATRGVGLTAGTMLFD